jgi:signal transduction histidine kinase
MLIDFAGCDALELHLRQRIGWLWSRAVRADDGAVQFGMGTRRGGAGCERALEALSRGPSQRAGDSVDQTGRYLAGDVLDLKDSSPLRDCSRNLCQPTGCRSAALLALTGAGEPVGLLALMSRRPGGITQEQLRRCEGLTGALSAAAVSQSAFAALRERVKELTCLYDISRLADAPGASIQDILCGIVQLLPSAWQYPEAAQARIVLEGQAYPTPGYREGVARQSAEIVANGVGMGTVEVVYVQDKPELDEGPFLAEERELIDAVAREVGLIIERRHAQEEQAQLREQLIHADRLATIGQLAAGVAHELNEPLGGILGFAQLAQKCPGLPQQAGQDLGKIVSVALQMREVIRKLLLFARQMPSARAKTDLNEIVTSGLSFFESRCATAGIALRVNTDPALPEIVGDAAQLNQVLVNLVVNAVQAMPNGGELTVETRAAGDHVTLAVRDTGVGMTEEVRRQIFVPFFTTKDVREGTGLGLPVVHGIVGAHGGRIRVESTVGRGTLFEVELPMGRPEEAQEGSGIGAGNRQGTHPGR